MILHCAPPYRHDISNPALGYLKGGLTEKEIEVTTIYWNVILYPEIAALTQKLNSPHTKIATPLGSILFVWNRLMEDLPPIPLNSLFSSFLPETDLSQFVTRIKTKIDQYIKRNNLHKTPVTGITVKTQQWLLGSYIMKQLKELNPDMHIVLGGISNPAQGRTFLKIFEWADSCIWGEGEYALFDLVQALTQDGIAQDKIAQVPQLIYRENNAVQSNNHKSKSIPLDEYPFADHTDYFNTLDQYMPGQKEKSYIPIWGSRSCPWNKCKFCVLNEEYTYRTRSPQNIINEIEYQSKKHGVDRFYFVDTDLAGNKKRFKQLLTHMLHLSASRGEPYHFVGEISPLFITDEIAHDMKAASFDFVQVGFEAVTDPLLKKMHKRHRVAHNIEVLKLGKRHSVSMEGLNIIRDIPSETVEDIFESCKNVKFFRFYLDSFVLTPSLFALYKGSPFYNEMSESERATWVYHRLWTEIASTEFIPGSDRFEFFGFFKERTHHQLWKEFETILNYYSSQTCEYTWIEYENGSFIEETGPKTYQYALTRDETDLLLFCDTVRSFGEVEKEFSHLKKEDVVFMMNQFYNAGLLYFDSSMRTIISVLDAEPMVQKS
ncbi:MAG: radical SAM protein [Candidatus Methanofastidiosia archaeon]|jgi:radical SAM superfamily enzyme YgiQ (UPF0313 family)